MQKTLKRTLSLLLTVVMLAAVFTVAPVTAGAAETDSVAVGDGESPETAATVTTVETPIGEIDSSGFWLKFEPEKDMNIEFYALGKNPREYAKIDVADKDGYYFYEPTFRSLNVGDFDSPEYYTKYIGNVTKGTIYYFELKNAGYETIDATFYLHELPDWDHENEKITAYYGSDTDITIPEALQGVKITAIADDVFRDNCNITSVTIPDGITSIGTSAFSDCTALTEVKLPSSITEISFSAFYGCNKLAKVELPSTLVSIADSAFSNCAIAEVNLPDSLKSIGQNAFDGCPIKSVVIPAGVTTLGANIFTYNDSNTNEALSYVTILNPSAGDEVGNEGEMISFAPNAFGGSDSPVKLLHCYPGSVADSVYAQQSDAYYKDKVAYLGENGPQVTFQFTENKTKKASANGTVKMPGTDGIKYGDRVFLGWSTKRNVNNAYDVDFAEGETVPIEGKITLYAVWTDVIKFYDDDGITPLGTYAGDNYYDSNAVCSGVQLPDKSGYAFQGFFDENNESGERRYYISDGMWTCAKAINVGKDKVDNNGAYKLYARWKKLESNNEVFLGQTVSLEDVVRLNFYVAAGWGNKINGWNPQADTEDGTTRNATVETISENGEKKYDKVSFKIYAKEMADNITFSYSDSGDIVVKTSSVKDYLEELIKNTGKYEEDETKQQQLKELCYATLNYGAAAQTYFKHNINRPANENVPEIYKESYKTVETNLTYDEGSQEDFSFCELSYYASSLGLFADTAYALCFEYTGAGSVNEAPTLQYFVAGKVDPEYESTNPEFDSEKGGYWVTPETKHVGMACYTSPDGTQYNHYMVAYAIPKIAAKDLLGDINVRFNYTAMEWKDEYTDWYGTNPAGCYPVSKTTDVYNFSPRTYLAKVLNQKGVDPDYTNNGKSADNKIYNPKEQQSMEDLKNTVKAIYDYSVKAKTYFGD